MNPSFIITYVGVGNIRFILSSFIVFRQQVNSFCLLRFNIINFESMRRNIKMDWQMRSFFGGIGGQFRAE